MTNVAVPVWLVKTSKLDGVRVDCRIGQPEAASGSPAGVVNRSLIAEAGGPRVHLKLRG
ncbi:MAG TPA: hypothetical protein VEH04_01190 [Verrucomicrobiae bacterium]|nr:hypothetical protein [Verrucomicrobiae bacterium]